MKTLKLVIFIFCCIAWIINFIFLLRYIKNHREDKVEMIAKDILLMIRIAFAIPIINLVLVTILNYI